MDRKKKFQFSLAAILFGMLVFAILFAETTQPTFRWLPIVITLAILQVVGFGVCAEALTRNIPSSLARSQRRNCRRSDGTWSARREEIEERSLAKLRRELLKAFFLIAVASNVLFAVIHFEVIPIPIAVEAMTSVEWSASDWKSNLRDEEAKFDSWIGHSTNNKEVAARKRLLWNSWPMVIGVMILSAAVAFAFVARAYYHALTELSASIKYRAQQYRLRELHKSVGHDDFAKVDRSRKQRRSRRHASSRT